MLLTPEQQLLSCVAKADQLVTEVEEHLDSDTSEYDRAEDVREMLIEMRARMGEDSSVHCWWRRRGCRCSPARVGQRRF